MILLRWTLTRLLSSLAVWHHALLGCLVIARLLQRTTGLRFGRMARLWGSRFRLWGSRFLQALGSVPLGIQAPWLHFSALGIQVPGLQSSPLGIQVPGLHSSCLGIQVPELQSSPLGMRFLGSLDGGGLTEPPTPLPLPPGLGKLEATATCAGRASSVAIKSPVLRTTCHKHCTQVRMYNVQLRPVSLRKSPRRIPSSVIPSVIYASSGIVSGSQVHHAMPQTRHAVESAELFKQAFRNFRWRVLRTRCKEPLLFCHEFLHGRVVLQRHGLCAEYLHTSIQTRSGQGSRR